MIEKIEEMLRDIIDTQNNLYSLLKEREETNASGQVMYELSNLQTKVRKISEFIYYEETSSICLIGSLSDDGVITLKWAKGE